VDVNIDGICGTVRGLDDSGAQLCLMRADVVAPLRLAKTGSVVLRDFVGNAYDADVISLRMKLANAKTFVPVVCAACDKLSNELLLGADIIDKLNRVWLVDQNVTVSDIDITVVSDENTCGTTKIMNNDVNKVKSPITSDDDDDDDDETVIDLDNVNKDEVSAKSINVADAEQIALEQQNDKSLALCISLADRDKAGYYIRDNILYRKENILGHEVEELCLPRSRRSQSIRLAHEILVVTLLQRKLKLA